MLPARRSPIFQANRAGSCQSMLRMAVGYTVQSRFVDHANLMTSGFDHTT
jgi:2-methylcitrate dehydratase PrpD